MPIVFAVDDPRAPEVQALLAIHLEFMRDTSPPEHVHALNTDGLVDPSVTFFSGRIDGDLVCFGALKALDPAHAELKSMHVRAASRRGGAGRALLIYLLGAARERGYARVSLETGTMDAFAPARALYEQAGFVMCPPFGAYTVNLYSLCMTMGLTA